MGTVTYYLATSAPTKRVGYHRHFSPIVIGSTSTTNGKGDKGDKGGSGNALSDASLLSREIISFDRKAGFAEGTYNLTKPRPSHRLGSQEGAKKWNKGAGNKRKPFKHFTTGIRVAIGRKG